MFTSFSTALSGLNADTVAIDVVGNNLANLNTTGFKASSVSFHDLMSQTIGSTEIGFGVGTPITLRQFTQGAIQSTLSPLDGAIQGDGFFVVSSPSQGAEYTRSGSFEVNSSGTLTTPTGEPVQGWSTVGGVLDTTGAVGNITVPAGTLSPPAATTSASVDLNLDATATAGPPAATFTSSVEAFDSLGVSHVVTFSFTKSATANQWNYSASLPAGDTTSPSAPITGTLTFDANGKLTSPLSTDPPPVIAATGLTDGAADMSINWNLFNSGVPRITQFAQPSATSAVAQDGGPAAKLASVGLSDGGQILARYSDGQQTVVGQLALATIRNPESLVAVGNNNFQTTALTALPAVGMPGTGGRGTVLGGSIESSTVDIAREFTSLIVFQRGYQANAKVITTVDQVSQDTINLKQ